MVECSTCLNPCSDPNTRNWPVQASQPIDNDKLQDFWSPAVTKSLHSNFPTISNISSYHALHRWHSKSNRSVFLLRTKYPISPGEMYFPHLTHLLNSRSFSRFVLAWFIGLIKLSSANFNFLFHDQIWRKWIKTLPRILLVECSSE
jgi:hypothetical protein